MLQWVKDQNTKYIFLSTFSTCTTSTKGFVFNLNSAVLKYEILNIS